MHGQDSLCRYHWALFTGNVHSLWDWEWQSQCENNRVQTMFGIQGRTATRKHPLESDHVRLCANARTLIIYTVMPQCEVTIWSRISQHHLCCACNVMLVQLCVKMK